MSRYSISKRNVPKLWRNKRIYSSSGGAGSSSPAISGTGTGTPNFVISASYAVTASYIEGFSIDSAYFTASEQLNVGDTTYYETNTHNLTVGSTASGETGGIEIVGNKTSGKIGGISFHNIASTQATDRKIAEIQGYVTADTQDGYVVTRVTNINGDAGYTSYETSEYHLWYAGQDPKLYLGTASLYPHTDLGLDLGTSDNRWDTIYTDNLDTPILTISEELILPSGSHISIEEGNIWFGFNDSLGPGYIAWGDELYKSDEDPGVPIVPVNYIDLQQEETLRFNAESGFSFNSPATIGSGIGIPALTPGGGFYRSGLIYESPDILVGTASYATTASFAVSSFIEYDDVANKPYLPEGIISSSYQQVMDISALAYTASYHSSFNYVFVSESYEVGAPLPDLYGPQLTLIVKNVTTSSTIWVNGEPGTLIDYQQSQSLPPLTAIHLATDVDNLWYII